MIVLVHLDFCHFFKFLWIVIKPPINMTSKLQRLCQMVTDVCRKQLLDYN